MSSAPPALLLPCILLCLLFFVCSDAFAAPTAFSFSTPRASTAFSLPSSLTPKSFLPSSKPTPRTSKPASRVLFTSALSLRAQAGSGSETGQSTDSSLVAERKKALLSAVAKGKAEDILSAASQLEQCDVVMPEKIAGRWSLVFSRQTTADAQSESALLGDLASLKKSIEGALYKFFFRFAPVLAGSQDRSSSSSSSSSSLFAGASVRNTQVLDARSAVVDNLVLISFDSPPAKLSIRVSGRVSGADLACLAITFTRFSLQLNDLPTLKLPLPRPVGELRTTFCDHELRLSRGGRGGLFVLRRLPATSSDS